MISTMYEYEKFKNISDIASNFYTIKIYSDVNLFVKYLIIAFKLRFQTLSIRQKSRPMIQNSSKVTFFFSVPAATSLTFRWINFNMPKITKRAIRLEQRRTNGLTLII